MRNSAKIIEIRKKIKACRGSVLYLEREHVMLSEGGWKEQADEALRQRNDVLAKIAALEKELSTAGD